MEVSDAFWCTATWKGGHALGCEAIADLCSPVVQTQIPAISLNNVEPSFQKI